LLQKIEQANPREDFTRPPGGVRNPQNATCSLRDVVRPHEFAHARRIKVDDTSEAQYYVSLALAE
jgi:hypothetical protein